MIDVPEEEIFRYLGYHGYMPDERIRGIVREVVDELQNCCVPHSIWRTEPYTESAGTLYLGPIATRSRSLEYHLRGCTHVVLYAATLGAVPDRMIQRYERTDMVRAAVTQAASAAMIEAYIDQDQAGIEAIYRQKGMGMKSRFSPGYGDFPLDVQPDFLAVLEMPKRIGVTLTDGCLMMPTKSVTAVMGLKPVGNDESSDPCSLCQKTDCEYRSEQQGDVS